MERATDLAQLAQTHDLPLTRMIEAAMGRFVHEAAPRHAEEYGEDLQLVRAAIASATCADDDALDLLGPVADAA